MAVFLDTSFYYAVLRKEDVNHARTVDIIDTLSTGKYGRIITSDYIMDESMTLISVRSRGRRDLIERMGRLFLGPEAIAHMVPIESAWLDEVRSLQLSLTTGGKPQPSFTDCSIIVCCKKHKIDRVVSFDGHFHGQIEVISK